MANKVISVYDSTKAIARPALSGDTPVDAAGAALPSAGGATEIAALTISGTAAAAVANKVQAGAADLNGATTAALKMIFEGGGALLLRMMSAAGVGKVAFYDEDVADDGLIALPTLANGGFVLVTASPEGGLAHLSAAGAVTILCGSTNFVGTETDAKLCVFDAGTVANIKNTLGSAKRVTAILFGS